MSDLLYRQLEDEIRQEITSGQRKAGDRLPSIKQQAQGHGLSKSTVLTAYGRLEAEGVIRARPRSGYYVAEAKPEQRPNLKTPAPSSPEIAPALASAGHVLVDIMEQGAAFDILPFADAESVNDTLKKSLGRAQRRQTATEQHYYDSPMGSPVLRQQLAQRMGYGGGEIDKDELVITAGCQHGLLLALLACTQRGDVVAVESPGFYGVLQLCEMLGLQVIELPCSAETGISPEALVLALEHWDIKALVITPSFSTPTGSCVPDENKVKLLDIVVKHGLAVVEDDIYGELHFGLHRPRTLYSFDSTGSVILCSSFSKSLSRDLRLGWIAPGKYLKQIKRLKLVTALSTSSTLQQGVSVFLSEGGMDRHLRLLRQQNQSQCQQLLDLLSQYIPQCLSCSQPTGGLTLWLELPEHINTLNLYAKAKEQGIIIAPGRLFTSQERYNNFLRMSFSHPWREGRVAALKKLAALIRDE